MRKFYLILTLFLSRSHRLAIHTQKQKLKLKATEKEFNMILQTAVCHVSINFTTSTCYYNEYTLHKPMNFTKFVEVFGLVLYC